MSVFMVCWSTTWDLRRVYRGLDGVRRKPWLLLWIHVWVGKVSSSSLCTKALKHSSQFFAQPLFQACLATYPANISKASSLMLGSPYEWSASRPQDANSGGISPFIRISSIFSSSATRLSKSLSCSASFRFAKALTSSPPETLLLRGGFIKEAAMSRRYTCMKCCGSGCEFDPQASRILPKKYW